MPLLGLGTWELEGTTAARSVSAALAAGYRHLDTATIYANERDVGHALAESGVPRDEVFVTTKCPPHLAGRELDTLRESLDLLGTDYVDLWLVHWPAGKRTLEMWRAFVEARELGLARDIGVSNFGLDLLDEVTEATGVQPAVNQIEWSPLLFDRRVLDGHRSRGVVLEGYSALRGGTLEHPAIADVARRVGRTPAQVIVRWHLQHEVVVIPRSSKAERIRANADVLDFELSRRDMSALDRLG
jgi:diketogulonate reductase-like aldo/keto reductase